MEKLLINRIIHYVYTNDLLNHNQTGFTPKKSTTDAVMTSKEFVGKGLRQGLITVLVRLGVQGAFDAAWWTGILKTLQYFNCPRNLFYLTKSYLSQRTALMTTNTLQVVRDVSKGCPQGFCCGPGQLSTQLEIWKTNKSNSLRRRFANSCEGRKYTRGRKYY